MITRNDLLEWMEENEEDVFMDGPYDFNKSQWAEFGKRFYTKMNSIFKTNIQITQPWEENLPHDEWNIYHGEVGYDMLLDVMADIINEYNITI